MDQTDVALAIMVVLSSLGCAIAALLIVARIAPARRVAWTPFDRSGESVAFLFEDDMLVDATPEAARLLGAGPEQMEEWSRLKAVLAPRFPDIARRLAELGERQSIEVEADDGRGRLRAEWRSGLTRIEVDDFTSGQDGTADNLGHAALLDELSDLRTTVDAAPLLVWKEDPTGAVRWANAAYIERALANDPESETLSWPLPQLFPDAPWRHPAEASDTGPERLVLSVPDEAGALTVSDTHFTAHRSQAHDGQLLFAFPSDDMVRAEASLHEFRQTLTKTFAHLPIGLAVFDTDRRLAMFNPALTDLTKIQPLFLSRRPTLFDFLDGLREARRMPEPKDYRDWRRRISDLEQAASNGTHIETWALPDGDTLRVTGRPHPNGGIALLIQDITSEVLLTRRFRSELELSQAVVDSLDEAIAVFSASRDLVLSNTAYEALWDTAPDTTLGAATLNDATALWEEASQPTPLWAELRARITAPADRAPWSGQVRLRDGRGLRARVTPLTGNAVLVGFALHPESVGAPLIRSGSAADGGQGGASGPGSPEADSPRAPDDRQGADTARDRERPVRRPASRG